MASGRASAIRVFFRFCDPFEPSRPSARRVKTNIRTKANLWDPRQPFFESRSGWMRKPDLILSDAPFSFEIRLLQQIFSAGKDIRRQANLCVLSLKNIELFQIQHGKDSSKCKQVAARLRSPARQAGPAKSAARQAGSTEKHTKKVSLYAIARVQRPSESPVALAEDYVPSEA